MNVTEVVFADSLTQVHLGVLIEQQSSRLYTCMVSWFQSIALTLQMTGSSRSSYANGMVVRLDSVL